MTRIKKLTFPYYGGFIHYSGNNVQAINAVGLRRMIWKR